MSHRTQASISKIRDQVLKPLPQDRTASATMEELRDPALDKLLMKGWPSELARLNNDPATAAGCPQSHSAEQPHVKAITVTDKQPENLLGMHQKQFAVQCLC